MSWGVRSAGEEAILAIDPWALVVRTGWLYGDDSEDGAFAALQRDIRLAADGGPALEVPDDEIGTPTYTANFALILFDMTLYDRWPEPRSKDDAYHAPLAGGIYHCADYGRASWLEFACEVARAMARHGLIRRVPVIRAAPASSFPGRAPRPLHHALSSQKLKNSMELHQHEWRDCLESYFVKKGVAPPVPNLFIRLHGQ